MEKFLLRAKIERLDPREGKRYTDWAEGYLNLVGLTEKGPSFIFAELERDDLLYTIGDTYCYRPTIHTFYHKDTLSRYTGLKDKNGKKIFEGDIIKFQAYRHAYRGGTDWIGTVTFDDNNALGLLVGVIPYRCDSNHESRFEVQISSKDKNSFEVIGNKWDNPELL